MGEVLTDVNVLGSLMASDDVVTPFNTRRVVLVEWGRFLLYEAESAQKCQRYKTSQPAADAE